MNALRISFSSYDCSAFVVRTFDKAWSVNIYITYVVALEGNVTLINRQSKIDMNVHLLGL